MHASATTPTATPAGGLLERLRGFLGAFSTLKEFVLAFAAVLAALAFVRDYFATRTEVEVLRCQMIAGRQLVEARLEKDKLLTQLLDLKERIAQPSNAAYRPRLETEVKRLDAEIAVLVRRAEEQFQRLDERVCQREVGR